MRITTRVDWTNVLYGVCLVWAVIFVVAVLSGLAYALITDPGARIVLALMLACLSGMFSVIYVLERGTL